LSIKTPKSFGKFATHLTCHSEENRENRRKTEGYLGPVSSAPDDDAISKIRDCIRVRQLL